MSLAALLTHTCDVEQANPLTRDASGGLVDATWVAEFLGVACQAEPVGANAEAIFLQAGFKVTHLVITQQAGIKAGRRLNFHDGLFLRVQSVETIRPQGMIDGFYKLHCEEIRLA
jgi:hypothetical protein